MRIRHYVFLLSLLFYASLAAQNKQVLYDFNDIPQALMVNPGMETDFQWYAGLPLLSGISGYAGTNGIAINDIFADDGLDINDKVRDLMVNGLTTRDEFSQALQIDLFSGGFRSPYSDIFYSFGAYLEMDNILYWPKDYAILAFDGNANQLDSRFNLGDLKTRGSTVAVYHFGINKKINKKLTAGVRAKLYSGITDYNATNNNGYLVNTEGQNNTIATTLNADMQLRTSGFGALSTAENQGTLASAFVKRAIFGGDLGLGMDLGFTYHLNERTAITGSVLDLGFMYHSGNVYKYNLKGNATIEGIQINVLQELADLNRDFWQDLVDDVEEFIPFETTNSAYVTFRQTRVNASIRHGFGTPIGSVEACDCGIGGSNNRAVKYRNGIGGQLFAINRPRGPQVALTGFYLRRFGEFMTIKGTYTIDKFSKTNVGVGLNLQAGPVNFYFMGDNLLSYQNIAASNYASFQLGLNIISWGKKK
ncbi:DUF5723 family protein [Maribacter antarcticus]|uniref:DUF5723 family protein n=1 Tax=Maribacter antarcticus TaxID=505250 RepID=UPI000478D671|nr:DUF5723 family protein [Maribacter antarcticus]